MEDAIILFLHWFGIICIIFVVGQIGAVAKHGVQTWYRERRKYRLPKPPDSFRLN